MRTIADLRKDLIVFWWDMCIENGWACKPFKFDVKADRKHGDITTNIALVGTKNLFKVKE